ncbi:MAG: GNAT family N-acetyltransferase [Acidimicrobiales bacterium]|jgi:ribosomal-protein-serine acetyltransferase
MPAPEDPSAVPYRFHAPREVQAGELVLRRWQEDDLEDLFESVSASLEHLRPWMPWADGYDLDGAREFLARQAPRATPDGDEAVSDAGYAMRDPSGRILGSCGLHGRLGHGALEIGYWVDVRHTRRGIARLAAALLTETAFALPGIERVEIHHDKANVASAGVPASLGFQHDATIVDEPEAPGEVGVEIQWTMAREAFPTSPAAKLLEDARR